MQDKDKEFDLRLRSMLDGVEEEVPQHVWEAVSGRISRRRTPVAWMRWAGVGVAAAAAVALALVLGGTFRGSAHDPVIESAALLAESQAETVIESAAEQEETGLIPEGIQTATTRRSPRREAVTADISTDVTPSEEQAAPVQTADEAAAPVQKTGEHSRNVSKSEPWSDPFALMAYEDSHKKSVRKASLGVNGLVGTNDGAKPGSRAPGAMGTPGTNDKTLISEDGESVYGVPVSLGLGARFHLGDRLALSTGITWSSLTRTFDGRLVGLSDTKSGISHNVQYIGIPVTLSYDIVSNNVLDFYTFAGGSVEKAVSNKYRAGSNTVKADVSGLQYSAALGLGVQFNLGEHVGLYLDPSARYWMGKDQPKSIRTQQPLMFNIEVGLRFEL